MCVTGPWIKPRFCHSNRKSRSVVLNGGDFALRGHLAVTGDIFTCHRLWEGVVLLPSGGQKPGMPLNILQCTGQSWQQRLNLKRQTVPKLRNLALDWNSTIPRMFTATSVLFPSEDLFSSRLTWYFYSGHHCDYREWSGTSSFFRFAWDTPPNTA